MAPTALARVPRWSVGLAVAAAGLLVVLFSYTGNRIYHLAWFYVAVLGFVAAAAGIAYVGYDRAIRPELERRRARGLPPPPPFRERLRSLTEEATLPASGPRPERAGKRERVRMSCPACAHVFAAEGVRPIAVHCPRCGLEGDLP